MPGRPKGGSRRPGPDEEVPPWERRHDESWQAWAAFRAYRDSAAQTGERSVVETYRALHPGRTATQAKNAKYFWEWKSKYDWDGRALEYDRHIDRVRQKGVQLATQAEGEKWVQRAHKLRETVYEVAQRLMQHVDMVSRMPPVRKTQKEAGGGVTVFEALPLREAKLASSILRDLTEVSALMVADGKRTAEEMRDTPDDPASLREDMERAKRELDEWQRQTIQAAVAPVVALDPPAGGAG